MKADQNPLPLDESYCGNHGLARAFAPLSHASAARAEQSGLHRSFRLNGKETAHAEFASIPARTRAGVAAPLETIATTNLDVQGQLSGISKCFAISGSFRRYGSATYITASIRPDHRHGHAFTSFADRY